MTTTTTPAIRRYGALGGFLALAFLAGAIGSVTQGDDVGGRYLSLDLPAWAPPQEAFGLVWPVLYLLIGLAGWRVWDRAGGWGSARTTLSLWIVQLAVNAAWPAVFFGAEAFGPAVAVIATLVAMVLTLTVMAARVERLAGALLLPYLAWITYAMALNIAIWSLN